MAFCGNCGAVIETGIKFCGQCGQPVSLKPGEGPRVIPSPPIEPPSTPNEKKRKKSKVRWLILAIGIPFIALGITYNWYGKDILKFKEKIIEKMIKGKPIEKVVKKQGITPPKRDPLSFDRSSLDRYVTTVHFFESGYGSLPVNERAYKTDFPKFQTRYINWEVKLKYPAPGQRIDFNIDAVWRRSDGIIYTQETLRTYMEPNWDNSLHSSGWGNRNPGTWAAGPYVVELYVEGKKIANRSFRIY